MIYYAHTVMPTGGLVNSHVQDTTRCPAELRAACEEVICNGSGTIGRLRVKWEIKNGTPHMATFLIPYGKINEAIYLVGPSTGLSHLKAIGEQAIISFVGQEKAAQFVRASDIWLRKIDRFPCTTSVAFPRHEPESLVEMPNAARIVNGLAAAYFDKKREN